MSKADDLQRPGEHEKWRDTDGHVLSEYQIRPGLISAVRAQFYAQNDRILFHPETFAFIGYIEPGHHGTVAAARYFQRTGIKPLILVVPPPPVPKPPTFDSGSADDGWNPDWGEDPRD